MAETASLFEAGGDLLGNPRGTAVASSPAQMTMIKLADGQRAVLVQAFPAVGHLGLGALVFGQFLREQAFSGWLALTGIAIWIACVTMAVVFAGEKQWISR